MRGRARPADDDLLGVIEGIYRSGRRGFVRTARAITRNDEAADDAVHEAFVKAVRNRAELRAAASARGWIWRIVVNEALRRRADDVRYVAADLDRFEGTATTNGRPERGDVEDAIAALPERQRLALFLRYYADLDYDAIADALGIARGTVSATLHTARAGLEAHLQEARR